MDYETFGAKPKRAERMDSERSNTSSREVNVFHSVVRTIDSPFGKLRVPSDLENLEKAFLILATVSILGVIVMTIYRLTNTVDDSDSTFGLVLLVNSVFCLAYIFHGVFGERPYELWAFMIATVAVTLYCVIEYAVTSNRTTVKLVRLIVLLAFAPVDLVLSFKISMQHYTSKNLIIRTLKSANIRFQNMCKNMFIFQTLLKFDFQTGLQFDVIQPNIRRQIFQLITEKKLFWLQMSLVVLVLTSGVDEADSGQIAILVVGSFLEILWLIVGYLVPKYEDRPWLCAFLVLSLPQPAYVLYKIIKTGKDWNEQSNTINVSIIACACLFLVTRCLVSFYLWIVVNNFGKGLREAVYFPEEKKPETSEAEGRHTPSPKLEVDEPDDDYLGENVHDDVHN